MTVGFALASTSLVEAADKPPFFGLQIQGMSEKIANAIGLKTVSGVMVRDIAYPGPASHSDISRGDVILELNGKAADSVETVAAMVQKMKPNSKVKAKIFRRGKVIEITVPIGARPPEWDITRNNFVTIPELGLTFAAMTDKVKQRFNIAWRARGVVVSLVNEEIISTDVLKPGDVILQANQVAVWKPGHVMGIYKKAQRENRESLLLLVERQEGFILVALPIKKS